MVPLSSAAGTRALPIAMTSTETASSPTPWASWPFQNCQAM